ncbi:MAG: hypothetical protein E7576_07555 [Ruminococcaceae bacterium]|nr:hypothetical protein [Oscillospiraceae bacterium]
MIEVKVSITAPELSEAITRLAAALEKHGISTLQDSIAQSAEPVKAPEAPAPKTEATPEPVAPAPVTETAPEKPSVTYTLDELGRAAAPLVDNGRTAELIALLETFGVKTLIDLKASDYPAFVAGLADRFGVSVRGAA